MPRLIDADRLLNPGYTDMFDEPIEFDMFSRYAIESEPTVEAIPVEWIDGYIKRKIKVGGMYAEMLYIYDMLKDWKKENESKRDNTSL